ncbi:hypothetical protein K3G39_03345 [Pontibacter sp. HSC-14F20]|uniref:hypothetical protein n=1 Tax=Pontibacter sp. HSC-14F20 TaxID=2864136 RepID=UPI001C7319F3|nr:hypothetical protein [Pontibacter sp. HSC-14F20]MBX0332262.1 hypothetical protein [Pontibacter sp. HSC-14F20]
MHQNTRPIRTRHYRLIEELANESRQDLPEPGMRRRAIAMTLLQQYSQLPDKPSLVPSAEGTLEAMVFTIPAYVLRHVDNPLWKVYSDMFLKLPTYTEFHLLVPDDGNTRQQLESWFKDHGLLQRCQFHEVPEHIKLLIWAEDDYEIVQHKANGRYTLVQPHSHRRAADDYTGYFLSKSLGLNRVKTPLYFEGGNLLVGDDFFLMGADYIVDSMLDLKGVLLPEDQTLATEELARLFSRYLDHDRKFLTVGSLLYVPHEKEQEFEMDGETWTETFHTKNVEGTVQPLFHIDMFITLAGRNRAGKYQVLVGDTRMASELLGENLSYYGMPHVFDDVAALLERQGFEVIRNPLPLTYVDNPEEKRRDWYYATSNNAVVEIKSATDKTVWLPTYGHGNWEYLQKTDEANKEVWEQLGFKVIQLQDFHPFAEKSGALHCIKKYLRRGQG